MKTFANVTLLLTLAATTARAQVNAGEQKPEPSLPFTVTQVATFNLPWRIAFLPDDRMLITEKPGALWLVTPKGQKTVVGNVPAVLSQGQGGMLGVFLSPRYATDHNVYLTYAEPGDYGSGLVLARARLAIGEGWASLEGREVLWRQMPKGKGGQFGAAIAFSPDGQYLFLTVGDRQRMTPAQDPDQELGKILRLTLDGKPAPGNPMAGKTGAASVALIDPPRDTEVAKTASVVSTYPFPGPNLAPAETWSTGHRTPYGLAFAPDGRLWELEHGPKGGDELNLIEPGKNYGWPLVSYAVNYNNVPIPSPDTRPDLTKPVIYWTPVIAPGSLTFYKGAMFPQWQGSALVGGMGTKSLNRITFDGNGGATPAERWSVDHRIRDVAVASDGAVWMIEDANPGGLFRVTPAATAPPAAGAPAAQPQSQGPQPFAVGNPVGMPMAPAATAGFNVVSSGVKVFGSIYSAESCSYDPERGVIVVPNRGVTQNVQTNDSWVSFINHDGSVHTARWIGVQNSGARASLTPPLVLNEPYGSDIANGVLYLADRDGGTSPTDPSVAVVRRFNLKTGVPAGEVRVDKSPWFNDIEVADDGTIYATQTGAGGPTADAATWQVWKITPAGAASIFLQGAPLRQPNGIAIDTKGNVVVANMGTDEILTFSKEGKLLTTERAAQTGSDGLVIMPDGTKYVSSVQNGGVSRIRPGRPAELIAQNIPSAASMCYDAGANQLVIPMNPNNGLAFVRLK